MRDGWDHVPLGELLVQVKEPVKVERGLAYKLLGVRWYGNGPFIRETVTSETSKATRLFPVQPGDFIYNRLFAWKGSFGLISHELEGCFVSSEFPLFRVRRDRLNAVLLNLIMCQPSKWAQIEIESTGSTSVSRNRWKEDRFLEQVLFLPSLVEQNRIVDVVTSVDTYIDALQQQADSARTARNAVLHELLSAGGDDWIETTLGDVASWGSGGTPKSGEAAYYDGDIPWCVIGDLTEGEVFQTEKRITADGLRNSSAKVIEPGAVMIAMYGASIGRTGLAAVPMATNQAIAFAYPKIEMLNNLFLLAFLQTQKSQFVEAGKGAAQSNISQTVLKAWPILLPPLAEQTLIVEIVSSMDEVIQSTEQALLDAKNLRSGLLSDLLSGEHEIPESYDVFVGAV